MWRRLCVYLSDHIVDGFRVARRHLGSLDLGHSFDYDGHHSQDGMYRRQIAVVAKEKIMPMIDIYVTAGTFTDKQKLAQDAATTIMEIEQVPDIPMFRQNTAAFVHELSDGDISNVDGDSRYVRVQVLTNAGALDREKQLAVVEQLTELVANAAADPTLRDRTWVLLTEAPEGGWGLKGRANTNAELVAAARAEIASLQSDANK